MLFFVSLIHTTENLSTLNNAIIKEKMANRSLFDQYACEKVMGCWERQGQGHYLHRKALVALVKVEVIVQRLVGEKIVVKVDLREPVPAHWIFL